MSVINESLSTAPTLAELFHERVRRSPGKIAYQYFDTACQCWVEKTWSEMADQVARWQAAMLRMGLRVGDRVAVMVANSPEWVYLDQAALGLGLVVVPLYVEDRPDNVAYITKDADVKLLLLSTYRQWQVLQESADAFSMVSQIVIVNECELVQSHTERKLILLSNWLADSAEPLQTVSASPDDLVSIVYTSGTTGKSKGVMLSHRNILSNAAAGLAAVGINHEDVFLSFLPLSHTLERTVGYYLPMMAGAKVVYTRSISQLGEDLVHVKPTVLISVPRIYERVYTRIQESLSQKSILARLLFKLTLSVGRIRFEYKQHRAGWSPLLLLWPLLNTFVASEVMERLGGRMRVAICGGAPLAPDVANVFISLGLPLLQGYGLTEASPIVSVNRQDKNIPHSIGQVLEGIEVRIGDNDELQTRSPCVMLGYWNNPEATAATFTNDQWLRTGDKARIDANGYIFITGRIKEILVLANGEKVPPADMEMAISRDALFEQSLVVGEGRRFLVALLVLNQEQWRKLASQLKVDPEASAALEGKKVKVEVLARVNQCLREFPGYAQIRGLYLSLEPWTVDNDLATPTMKLKRGKILDKYKDEIEKIYSSYQKK